ncbi:MAG: hypothetical protein IH851_04855 [Armatimonadetes bacterium]|nr:hypothetical protein [Armatimonadota bacterium]
MRFGSSGGRWTLGLAAVLAVNLWGLALVLRPGDLWGDPANRDLQALLETTREEPGLVRWFLGDWPLGNGFYRPLPSLTFKLDDLLHADNLRGYRFTNWLICAGCSFLLVWFVWEVLRSRRCAIGCGALLAAWQSDLVLFLPMEGASWAVAAVLVVYGLVYGRSGRWCFLAAAAIVVLVGQEMQAALPYREIDSQTLGFRVIEWPPGRTATLMTLFGLTSLGAYCRFEREGLVGWGLLSLAALTAALGCYEQAAVLPAALLGCAVTLRFQGVSVRWLWHLMPWTLVGAYLFLHTALLPADTSYRVQQARAVSGGIRDLAIWLFRPVRPAIDTKVLIAPEIGFAVVVLSGFWLNLARVLAYTAAYFEARRAWLPILFGLLGSTGAYAALAFQHPFAHYFYFPFAFRTVFVAALIALAWKTVVTGASRRALPAPGKRAP